MATAPDPEVLCSTDGKDKFQRISRLLISGGTTLLREVFDQICPPFHLPSKSKDPNTKKQLKSAKLTKPQRDCLYPSPGTYGESKGFDITLLFALLKTICNLTPPSTGWDILPAPTDHSLVAELARIKHYRNAVYGHVKGNMEITDDEFLQLWENISQALIGVAANLGPTSKCNDWQTKIDKLLKDPLTAEDERNVQELQEWYKKDEDIKKSLDQLVDTTQKGKDSIERMEKNVEEIKKYLSELYELRPNSCENCTCTDAAILPVKLSCEIYAHSDQQGDLCGMSVNGDASRATAQEVLNQIAKSYLQIVESSTKKECNEFMKYLTRMGEVLAVDVIKGSLMIKVGCRSVQILSDLYIDFLTGHLNALAQEHLVTERVLTKFALMEAKLTTNISENEYRNCRKQLKAYAVLEPKVLDLKNRRDKLQEKFLEWVKVRKKSEVYLKDRSKIVECTPAVLFIGLWP
nr:uncharacterized protein LOC131791513 [Pocillopora verrucosa]